MFTPPDPKPNLERYNEVENHLKKLFAQSLVNTDLQVKTLCTLERAGIRTLGQLVTKPRYDVQRIPRLGASTISEIDSLLLRLGLTFGMKA